MSEILFTNARLIDPVTLTDAPGWLRVAKGKIVESGDGKAPEAKGEVVDCGGLCLAPGIIDIGVKVSEPGERHKESFRSAALAVRAGMTPEGALRAVTIANARMLGMEARVGTLETGKDADFILLSGDPLSVYTEVEQTWVDGVKVFDLSDPTDRLYARGGPGAGENRRPPLCCFGSAWDIIMAANGGNGQ